MNDAMPQGDVSPRQFPVLSATPMIRQATLIDIPFIMELAREKYPHRDVSKAEPWAKWCIQNPDRLVLIGPNSVGCAQVDWIYGHECKARLDVLAARPGPIWEALRMLRVMINWARQKGASGSFILDANTGIDFGSFSERLGGKKVTITQYEIPLERGL